MEHHSKQEARINEVLSSLDGMKRATVNPFFYSRLQAALEREAENPWQRAGYWLNRPLVAMATGLLILGMNIFLLFSGPSASVVVREPESEGTNVYSYVPLPEETHYVLNEEHP